MLFRSTLSVEVLILGRVLRSLETRIVKTNKTHHCNGGAKIAEIARSVLLYNHAFGAPMLSSLERDLFESSLCLMYVIA